MICRDEGRERVDVLTDDDLLDALEWFDCWKMQNAKRQWPQPATLDGVA